MPQTKTYFAVVLIGLLVLGFLATSVVSYFIAQDSLIDRIAEESLPLTSDNIYAEIERDLLRSILISSLMAHDTFVRDWLLGGEKQPGQIIRYLGEVQKKYDTTTAFFVSDRTLRYYHPNGVVKVVDPGDPDDAWYDRVRRMNAPYEINIDTDTADRSRITIFVNYRVTDYSGNYIGVTGIGLSVKTVSQLIERYQRRYNRQIYFIDREGEVTVRGSEFTGPVHIREHPGMGRFATRVLANPSTSFSYQGADGATVYVNSRLVPEFGWYLMVEQSVSVVEARILNTLLVNMLIALAIAALVVVVAYYTVRGYQQRLEHMATTDKLTGAANRHVFQAIFNHVASAAKRRDDPVALLSLDIDHFKNINDTYGHQAGDIVLRKFVDIINENIRDADTLCRWGGDEFMILMGNCRPEDADRIAQKIRNSVGAHTFPVGDGDRHIAVSIGVAHYVPGEDLASLIRRADEALYESKRQGRNRVVDA